MISRGIGKSAARSVARSLSQFGSGGVSPSYDTDAQTYITAVEAADGESLETGVKDAINAFVVGCKADGIWTAIKASCILAGARTLTGALVPLVGTAPTNNNFVSGDYSRTAGLTGNGVNKYLDSNRNNNADPQNNQSLCVYVSSAATAAASYAGVGSFGVVGSTNLGVTLANGLSFYRSHSQTVFTIASTSSAVGFFGLSRDNSSDFDARVNGTTTVASITSETPHNANVFVFARNSSGTPDLPANNPIAFYSIGESLDLALLDSRVTTLITDIGTALA